MIQIALDTCFHTHSIAMKRGSDIFFSFSSQEQNKQCENLLLDLDSALSAHGLSYGDISLVCISVGPGSFTGTRIGIATALGFAIARDIEVWGYSTLQCMLDGPSRCLVSVPAGRGRYYQQEFAQYKATSDISIVSDGDDAVLNLAARMLSLHRLGCKPFAVGYDITPIYPKRNDMPW